MTGELLALGANHKTAPLPLREKVALPDGRAARVLAELVEHESVHEAVAISTCNRTELYLVVADPVEAENLALGILSRQAGLRPTELLGAIYSLHGRAVVEHLFSVTSGLDSMIVGEAEVQGQVKRSYEMALVEGVTGELFRPFSFTVTIALLASLLVSLTIVPVLAYWFLKPAKLHKHEDEAEVAAAAFVDDVWLAPELRDADGNTGLRPTPGGQEAALATSDRPATSTAAAAALDADLIRLTLAINGIDAVVSPSSVFPSVDFVQGLRVSVRSTDEEAALAIVRGLPLVGPAEDGEPGTG